MTTLQLHTKRAKAKAKRTAYNKIKRRLQHEFGGPGGELAYRAYRDGKMHLPVEQW